MKRQLLVLAAASLLAASAAAQVSVSDPWVRATVPQQKASGAFMRLESKQAARLVEVRSPVAGTVEIHQMEMKGQMMTMHAVDGIDLPAGKPVELASGSYHLMLLDLKRPLKEGETIGLTLVVQGKNKQRETIELTVPVKALGYTAPVKP